MKLIFSFSLILIPFSAFSQAVTLRSSPYTETFDGISSGLPSGWTVRTEATSSNLGTEFNFATTTASWGSTGGGFKNVASSDGLTSGTSVNNQAASADRSVGIRQIGILGDPGAAFVVKFQNAADAKNLVLSFKLQSLTLNSPRETTWLVDYGLGENPTTFIPIANSPNTLLTGNTTFSNQSISVTLPSILDGTFEPFYVRIVTLTATTGGGNRTTSGIDDFTLEFEQLTGTDPIILATTTSLSNFATSEGTTSSTKSYSVRAENLTNDLLINSPSDFEISTTQTSGFGSSLTLSPTNGSVSLTTIFVR